MIRSQGFQLPKRKNFKFQRKQAVAALALTVVIVSLAAAGVLASGIQIVKNADLVWEKTFGGAGDDRAFHIAKAKDGYIVVGSTTSIVHGKTAAWVLKLNSDGDEIWNRTFSSEAGAEFRFALPLGENWLLVGNVFTCSGGSEGYVVMVDGEGLALWESTLKSDGFVGKLFSAVPSGDGGFTLAGLTVSEGNGYSDVWVVQIDAAGRTIWSKTYGGPLDDAGRSIVCMDDGSFMVVGYTESFGNGDYDFYLLKIDQSGNLVWNQTYGAQESEKAYAIVASHGGYLLVGDTRSKGKGDSDAFMVNVNDKGYQLWERTCGGTEFDMPTCVYSSEDGGFLIGGFTFSFGNGQRDFWLFKLSDQGDVLWSCTVGKSGFEEAYGVVEPSPGKFVLAGWTSSIGQGKYDFYVVEVTR